MSEENNVAKAAEAALEKALPVERTHEPTRSAPLPPVASSNGYEQLARILSEAYKQSATGKGRERHAVGFTGFRPWHEQPILALARITGPGSSAYQVMKKVQEACTMIERKNFVGAKAEVLGAIVYCAALYKLAEEMEHPNAP